MYPSGSPPAPGVSATSTSPSATLPSSVPRVMKPSDLLAFFCSASTNARSRAVAGRNSTPPAAAGSGIDVGLLICGDTGNSGKRVICHLSLAVCAGAEATAPGPAQMTNDQ